MDQQFVENLVATLRGITAPDTAAIQQASQALQNDFYKSPVIVPALVHILQTHPETSLRQLAGVEVRKLIDYRWADLSADIKAQTKGNLLQTTIAEPDSLVRHTSSRVISTIAKQELDDNLWPELLPALSTSVRSTNPAEREVAVYILYTLLEADLGVMIDYISDLLDLFSQSIKDPESLQVRVSTIMALGEISTVLSSFQGVDSREGEVFRATVPSMVEVLKQVIEANDEKAVGQIFEVFSFLLVADATLTSKYFGDLISFVLNQIAAEKQLSEEFRVPALQYLISAVRSKKMKIQSLKLGPSLISTAMSIIAEYYAENEDDLDEDDEDEMNETNPATISLQLIDNLSNTLPPAQVNAPLLHVLSDYIKSLEPAKARAGYMSLAYAVEGAPDFFAEQVQHILPLVIHGLQQGNPEIQSSALFCLYYLGCELREVISEEHETLLPLIFNIMDNASHLKVGKNAFQALESILECMDRDVISKKYIDSLIPKLLHLFSETNNNSLKALIINAISSAAFSAGKNFLPYFQTTMQTLEPYVALTQNIESLSEAQSNLCGSALDTLGSIAASVGKENFRPFVEGLFEAAYKCMKCEHSKVRESGFICVGTLARIYGHDFAVIIPKIVGEIYSCLDQDEFGNLPDDVDDVGLDEENFLEKIEASSAIAIEKEYATDTLGDLIEASGREFPDLEKAITYLVGQTQHYSDGIRKSSLGALWRAYLTWVKLDDEGKWTPGLPATEHANPITAFIAGKVRQETFDLLEHEEDRVVAIAVCQRLTEGLKNIGPRVILNSENLDQIITQIGSILIKQHRSQAAMEDEVPEDGEDDIEESSEYDAVLIDSAFDVVVQLAASLGTQFTPFFPGFISPIAKFCASNSGPERAAAIGAISEIINAMGAEVSQFTGDLMKILLHSLSDKNTEARSNASYGVGLLCYFSTDSQTILSSYPTILEKLQKLLKKVDKATRISNSNADSDDNNARCLSNACGCVSRMILKHPNNVPVSDVVNVLLNRLPLTDGLEENTPVFELIAELIKNQESTIINRREDLVKIFAQVFEQEKIAKEELITLTTGNQEIELPFESDEIRAKVIELLKFLETSQPGLVSNYPILVASLS